MSWKFWKKDKKKQQKKEDNFSQILNGKVSNLRNNVTGEVTQSAVEYGKRGRYLKLNDDDCALVIHAGEKLEVIFTKLYDPQNQAVTPEEQTLMSLAIFLKQPGFGELIRHEFNRIAQRNINQLTEQKENKK